MRRACAMVLFAAFVPVFGAAACTGGSEENPDEPAQEEAAEGAATVGMTTESTEAAPAKQQPSDQLPEDQELPGEEQQFSGQPQEDATEQQQK